MKRSVTPVWKDKNAGKGNVNGYANIFGKDIKNTIANRHVSQKALSSAKVLSACYNLDRNDNKKRQEYSHYQIHEQVPISEYLKSQSSDIPSTIKSPLVNVAMRKLTVNWLIQVCHKLSLKK
jgi:hypothetical protein